MFDIYDWFWCTNDLLVELLVNRSLLASTIFCKYLFYTFLIFLSPRNLITPNLEFLGLRGLRENFPVLLTSGRFSLIIYIAVLI